MVRTTRRWLCWSVCFLLLFSFSLMAQEQETTLPFDESNISLLESNLMHSVTVTTAGTHKVTLETPPTIQGQILLAVYDQNSRFKKVVSVHSNGQTSVEFSFEETPLEIGSYVRAFFVGSNWEPLATSSAKIQVEQSIEVSDLFLSSDGLLSFKTSVEGASLRFNENELSYVTVSGWNQVQISDVESTNNLVLHKLNCVDCHYTVHSQTLIALRIDTYPKRIYQLNEALDLSGMVLEGTTDSMDWITLPINSEQMLGFDNTVLGDQNISFVYGSLSIDYQIKIISEANQKSKSVSVSIQPTKLFQQEMTNININYIASENLFDGFIEFVLPEGMKFSNNDVINGYVTLGECKLADLGSNTELSSDSKTLVIKEVNLYTGAELRIVLAEQAMPKEQNINVLVRSDADGEDSSLSWSDYTDYVINLQESLLIQGRLLLPDDIQISEGSIDVYLSLIGTKTYSKIVKFEIGNAYQTFRFVVPNDDYALGYQIIINSNNAGSLYYLGYYQLSNTVFNIDDSYYLNSSNLPEVIELRLVKSVKLSGKVYLADDVMAMKDTVSGWLVLSNVYDTSYFSTSFIIPANSREVNYSISIPASKYVLRYDVYNNLELETSGYYTETGYVRESSIAEPILVTDDSIKFDIPLSLPINKTRVYGSINLPDDFVALSIDIPIKLSVHNLDTGRFSEFDLFINAGENSLVYSVPTLDTRIILGIAIDPKFELVSYGYYSFGGIVRDYFQADEVIITNGHEIECNLRLIKSKSYVVSGSVLLADNLDAPDIDISLEVHGTKLVLKKGTRSVDFSLIVEKGETRLSYFFDQPYREYERFIPQGFYSTSGTVYSYEQSSLLLVDKDITGIQLVIRRGFYLSGSVSLPDSVKTFDSKFDFALFASTSSYSVTGNATFSAGLRKCEFKMLLPEGQYNIQYWWSSVPEQPFVKSGYYSTNGMTIIKSEARMIDVNQDIDNIDLTFIMGHWLSGKIYIPVDDVVNDKEVSIQLEARSSTYISYEYPRILAGTREVLYKMVLPKGDFTLRYHINNLGDSDYITDGYYSSNPTNQSYYAKVINVDEDISGIDITLSKGHIVTGEFKIPESDETITSDIQFQINASSSGYSSWSNTFILQAGTREAQYQMVIPDGIYTVRYWINSNPNGYLREGYYSVIGTTSRELADNVIVTDNISDLNIYLVKPIMTGTVSLPQNMSPLATDIYIDLVSESANQESRKSVIIKAGERSTTYTLNLLPGENRVKYDIGANNDFVQNGYYRYGNTSMNASTAQTFYASSIINNIHLTLIPAFSLSGNVKLPIGELADLEGISVKLTAEPVDSSSAPQKSVEVRIEPNQTTTNYEINQLSSFYRLKYEILSDTQGYESTGYLGTTITVTTTKDSRVLQLSTYTGNLSNIDLELLGKITFQGTISLPPSDLSNTSRLPIRIYASGSNLRVIETEIPENQTTTQFSAEIPIGSYEIYYELMHESSKYALRGFYYEDGMQQTSLGTMRQLTKEGVSDLHMQLIPLIKMSGVISLPNGLVAPKSGVLVKLYLYGSLTYSQQVIIPSGSNSALYELYVPSGSYKLLLVNESLTSEIMPVAYYNELGMKIRPEQASEVYVSEQGLIRNLQLLPKPRISGVVSLPTGMVAPQGGLSVLLRAYSPNAVIGVSSSNLQLVTSPNLQLVSSSNLVTQMALIPAGVNSSSYSLSVNPGRYTVSYETITPIDTLHEYGYYTNIGTSLLKSDSITIQSDDISNINLNLLARVKIRGHINLPQGVFAPESGVLVKLYLYGSLTYSQQIIIPSGSNSAPYELMVPSGSYKFLLVNESLTSEIMPVAYFNELGMKIRPDQASEVYVSEQGLIQNLQLIPKPRISGVVSLPTGMVAPQGGLSVLLRAYSPNAVIGVSSSNLQLVTSPNLQLVSSSNLVTQTVDIPENANSASYTMLLNPGEYSLSYDIRPPSENLISRGYYSLNGTTETETQEIIVVSKDVPNVACELLERAKITGQIILPQGIIAPAEGIGIQVSVSGSESKSTTCHIAEGESSDSFVFYLSPGEYTVHYSMNNDLLIEQEGYLNNEGYISKYSNEARIIQVSTNVNNNIEIRPQKMFTLTGVITTDNLYPLPDKGLSIMVRAIGREMHNMLFSLTQNQPQTEFSFLLPEGTYKLAVVIDEEQEIFYKSGYLFAGTLIQVSETAHSINLNSNQAVGTVTIPTKVVNYYETPDFVPLGEIKVLQIGEGLPKDVIVVDSILQVPLEERSSDITTEAKQSEEVVDSLSETEPTETNEGEKEALTDIPVVSDDINETKDSVVDELKEKNLAEVEGIVEAGIGVDSISQDSLEENPHDITTEATQSEGIADSPSEVELMETVLEETDTLANVPVESEDINDTEDSVIDELEETLAEEEEIIEEDVEVDLRETEIITDSETDQEKNVEDKPFTDIVEPSTEAKEQLPLVGENERIVEKEIDSLVLPLAITPTSLNPIIVRFSSSISSLVLTIKLPVGEDITLSDVWIGSEHLSVQLGNAVNFSLNNLVVGTTIYEILTVDSNENTSTGKLIVVYGNDSQLPSDLLPVVRDTVGPVINLDEVYTAGTATYTVSFSVSDTSKIAEVWVGDVKALVRPDNTVRYTVTNLTPGINEFEVLAYDVEGNGTIATLVVEYLKPSTVLLTIGSTFATKDGANMTGMDQAPVIVNGRVFLPFRFVFMNLLGSTVDWDAYTQTITSVVKGNTIKMVIGSRTAYVNGNAVVMLEAPYIESMTGRTLVPMREIMEAIGISLDWNGTTQTVNITIPQ